MPSLRGRKPETIQRGPAAGTAPWMVPHAGRWALVLILLVGGALRLVDLRQSPPGLNQDEAVNSWNAWCLLKTGCDQAGERWPIFSMRAHGVYSSPLFSYWSMPFEGVGGLNVWTTRLPAAVGGVLTILLVYYIGTRMFGQGTGLAAALLLALSPWHIQQSRWGHEAALCPLLVAAAWACMLWANLPLDDERRRPRWLLAGLAGVVTGLGCYGYPAMRAFLPAFVVAIVAVNAGAWWGLLKDRSGRPALAAFVLGGLIVFGPLVWKHLSDPQRIGQQLQAYRAWKADDSPVRKVLSVVGRYPCHFGPDFLFLKGDVYPAQSPPGMGMFHLYMLPLFVAGLAIGVRRWRTSRACRVVVAAALVYPVGDCLTAYAGGHALRSLPGLCGLVLLAAMGLTQTLGWLAGRQRTAARAAGVVLALAVAASSVMYLPRFFGAYNRDPIIYHNYHADLLEACEWLRPRFKEADAVFVTPAGMNMPYIITLVGLEYDPRQWLADVHDVQTVDRWDYHKRYGKVYFAYDKAAETAIQELKQNNRKDHVFIIVRPEVAGLGKPVHQIRRPDGAVTLCVYELWL